MHIKSAVFVKGVVGEDEILDDGIPQVPFIGRSNVGKSSVINSLTGQKNLARSSPTPGRTREINFFLINNSFYLVDLPGYGFAKASLDERDAITKLIYWYLLFSDIDHKKVVLIIDAHVGVTSYDAEMLRRLEDKDKKLIIVANKIDKIKKSDYVKQMRAIQGVIGDYPVIPYSAEKKIGVSQLATELLK